MVSRSTLLHLRFPFSLILLPFYLFALSAAEAIDPWKAVIAFVVLHLLLYPAVNGFNSYYDRDEESIGTLKRPPPVTSDLLWVSLAFDAAAIGLSLLVDWIFALATLAYGLCAKLYSWDKTRLKRYPFWGLLGAALVSGALGFLMSYHGVRPPGAAAAPGLKPLWGAGLAALFHLSSFPLTQVYQHAEDGRRGDRTLSLALGVRGTFVFSGTGMAVAVAGTIAYCLHFYGPAAAAAFTACAAVPGAYLLHWQRLVWRDPGRADYAHSMRLTFLSAGALGLFFGAMTVITHALRPAA